ncbi:hypothetical protein DSM112329_00048 [Paraconexibacter sp. AEG42_29]|uniref:Flagellar FliJ protein n=1 Tax=Paraconexibacter sp. AEG42_29 TaxID=2997339 RepID=A0AAU7ANL3_9ACTN
MSSESPFRFGLERVREVRVHDEQAAQEILAASLTRRGTEQAALAAAERSLAAARLIAAPAVEPAAAVPVTGAALLAGQAWVQRLERRREQAVHASDRAEAQVGEDRVKVLAAARRREALDRLRDRRRAEHSLAAGRAECARLDEIALRGTRYASPAA